MTPLRSSLTERRRAAGLSLTALAARVGVSRQALTAVEAGRSIPSTALALQLARALGCGVEDLFTLEETPFPNPPGLTPGTRVVLGRVGGRWVAEPLEPRASDPADGLVDATGRLQLLHDPRRLGDNLLVAGCAPVLGTLAGHLDRSGDGGARWLHRTSQEALSALAEDRAHVAGLHLATADAPEVHDAVAREHLGDVDIVTLVVWREGLAVAPGNPKGLRSAADLARPGIRVGRRPEGAGATRVLARALAEAGVELAETVSPWLRSHEEAAAAVLHGAADAAVLVEPVAEAYGLGFVPWVEERFELVVPADRRSHPGVQRLLDRLTSDGFAREVRSMGAYDTRAMGAVRRVGAA